jgi:streptogramin lyase
MDMHRISRASAVVAIIAAVLAALLGPPAAASPPDDITEYTLPGRVYPNDIAAGPEGNVWFTAPVGVGIPERADSASAGKIGRITPTGAITEYKLPYGSDPYGITAGPDGNLWFTETIHRPPARLSAIGRITPTGTITEYPLPAGNDFSPLGELANGSPNRIAAGPDGNLWFTGWGNQIGRITPTGTITQYPTSGGGIAAGPDGNLWFTAYDKIGRITPSGAIAEYGSLPISSLGGIVTGADSNLWFAGGNMIGRITPSGTMTAYPLPTTAFGAWGPRGIAAGSDGNLWFPAFGEIVRITPAGIVTEYKLPYGSTPRRIAAGPDGNLWFTDGYKIGRISPNATPIRKWTCPLTVTLHKPAPKTMGHRILTDKIKTNNFCVLPKPVVRCRPRASSTDGKKALCVTKVTTRGKIRVTTNGYEAVRVTVTVRATPKNKPGFPGPWKGETWRRSWLLR